MSANLLLLAMFLKTWLLSLKAMIPSVGQKCLAVFPVTNSGILVAFGLSSV